MPQGSILGSLLFVVYVNGVNKASDIVDSIMVADDTNLLNFQSQLSITKNIWVVQSKEIIFKCYQNYTLFHKNFTKDELPVKMPESKICNIIIKRKYSVKFLGEMLDENISWKDHIKTIERNSQKYWFIISCKTIFFIYSFIFKLCKLCLGKYFYNKFKIITL